MAAAGLSVAGDLGREPRAAQRPVERRGADVRPGVWRLAYSRIAPRDDRTRTAIRHTNVPMDTRSWLRSRPLRRLASLCANAFGDDGRRFVGSHVGELIAELRNVAVRDRR